MKSWILLRGLTREQRHWGGFPEHLRKEFPEDRIMTLELPGNGVLHAMSSPLAMAAMATHCRAEMVKLGIPPPFHLVAMSMGAMVASAWADGHPEEVDLCVLINTSFASFSPLHHRLRPGAWLALLQILLARSPHRREACIFKLTSRQMPAPLGLIEAWVAIRESRPVGLGNALRQLFAAARFRPPATAKVPSLVLTSLGDALVDPRCTLEIARRWQCAVAIHPSAGHDLPLDDGPWVAKSIQAWLLDSGLPR